MPKWKRGTTEYTVSVNICGNRGHQSTIPMPLIDMLGRPEQITFHVRGSEIVVTPGPEGAPVRTSKKGRKRPARASAAGGRPSRHINSRLHTTGSMRAKTPNLSAKIMPFQPKI